MLTGMQVTIYWEDNGVSNLVSGLGWSLLLLLSEQPGDFNGCALRQRHGHFYRHSSFCYTFCGLTPQKPSLQQCGVAETCSDICHRR